MGMSEVLGSAVVQLAVDDRRFNQQISTMRLSIASTLGSLASAGIGSMVSGMKDLAGAGFQFNSQMEDAQLSFAAMLGSEKKAVALLEKLKAFSDVTPFEFPDMTKAAGMMLSTGKFTDKQIPGIVEKLSDAAAGSTKGLGALPNISLAMSQIVSKIESGKISAQDMNQLIEAGVHPWQALAKAVGVSEAEVRKMAQNGGLDISHVNGMIDELGEKYKGLAKIKGEKTLSGLISTLKDKINSSLGSISIPLFEEMKVQAKGIIEYLNTPAFTDWTKRIAGGIATAIQFMKDLVNNPVAQAVAKFALLAGGVLVAVGAIKGLAVAIGAVWAMAPVIALVGAITGLVALIKKAFDGPEGAKFRETIGEIARNVGEIAENFAGKLLPAAMEFADSWASALGGSEGMKKGLGGVLEMLKKFTDWLSLITANWDLLWEEVDLKAREMWQGLVDWMITKIGAIGPAISEAIKSGWSFLKEDAKAKDSKSGGAALSDELPSLGSMLDPVRGNLNPIQAVMKYNKWAIGKLADNPTVGKYVNASVEGLKAGLNRTGMMSESVARSVSSWGDMRDRFNAEIAAVDNQESKIAAGQKNLRSNPASSYVAAETPERKALRERREALDAKKDAASQERDILRRSREGASEASKVWGELKKKGGKFSTAGNSLFNVAAEKAALVGGVVAKGANKFNPLGGPVDAKKAAKPFQNDFLGFGDLNRQIQQSLGKQSEKEAAKKASEAAKKTEKNTSDAAKAAQAIVDPIRDMARGIRDAIGMGS